MLIADTAGTSFNKGFDTVKLHQPTMSPLSAALCAMAQNWHPFLSTHPPGRVLHISAERKHLVWAAALHTTTFQLVVSSVCGLGCVSK